MSSVFADDAVYILTLTQLSARILLQEVTLQLRRLYAGVRLRNNKEAGPFPGKEDDIGMPFFECQLNAAQSDLKDEFLEVWTKQEGEALAAAPPRELRPAKEHTGWRDPFIFETPSEENDQ